MSKSSFFLLVTLGFLIATIAIGIRGIDNWEPWEFFFYYGMLGWGAVDFYRRRVLPTPA